MSLRRAERAMNAPRRCRARSLRLRRKALLGRPHLRLRQRQYGLEPLRRTIAQDERAAVRLRDVARDAEPETYAAGRRIARAFQPEERLEHLLERLGRYTGTFVENPKDEVFAVLDDDGRAFAVFDRIRQQVRETAFQS